MNEGGGGARGKDASHATDSQLRTGATSIRTTLRHMGYLPYQNTSRENQLAAFFGCTARPAEAGGGMGAGFYVKGLPANGNCLKLGRVRTYGTLVPSMVESRPQG